MRNICLISPGHVSFNPRLVKEADALAEAGYRVHVIAANDLPQLRHLDAPILKNARWSYELAGGWSAGTRAKRALSKLCRILFGSGVRANWIAELGHHALTADLRRRAISFKADLYIAHYIAAIPAAHDAARTHQARWGFDAEDFHSGEFQTTEKVSSVARIVERIELQYLAKANHFTAASPGISSAYARWLKRAPPQVILNVFPLVNAPEKSTLCGNARPGPSLYWFSQTIGADRGLEFAVAAVAAARSQPHLYLRGNMQAGFEQKIRELSGKLGVSDRIHLLPTAPASEMERLASSYDLGLVSETGETENRAIALTNKLFSFLLAGLPALASDIPAHRDVAQRCSSIKLFQNKDPNSLAAVIDSFLLHPDVLAAERLRAWEAGQRIFNWDLEKAKLVRLVREQIGAP